MRAQGERVPSIFVTGPVRSGKSRFAEALARERGGDVLYVATARADPDDAEWSARIAHHVERRPAHWRTIETARADVAPLAAVVRDAPVELTLIVDSLGTWLGDRMSGLIDARADFDQRDVAALETETNEVVDALLAARAYAIVVGEEVGWGIVPAYPSGRAFRDVLGRAQQRLAAGSLAAYLIVSGFAIDLHAHGRPITGAP